MNRRIVAVLAAAAVVAVVVGGCGGTAQNTLGATQAAGGPSPGRWAQGIARAGLGPSAQSSMAAGSPGSRPAAQPTTVPATVQPRLAATPAPQQAKATGALSSDLGPGEAPASEMAISTAVSAFYSWYLGFSGDPLDSRAYRTEPHLTRSFTERVDARLIRSELDVHAQHVDPFVCRTAGAVRAEPGAVRAFGDEATVTVRMWYRSGAPGDVQLRVVSTGGSWQIDEIACPVTPGK